MALCTAPELLADVWGLPLDLDATKSGLKLSTVDLDDNTIDDTVGFGIFADIPYNQRLKVGGGFDFWQTAERPERDSNVTDASLGIYGKAYFVPYTSDIAPYAVAGTGLHHVLHEKEFNMRPS